MTALVLSLIKQQALIFALIVVFGGTSEDGRLTDWTCWMLILALASFTLFVGRVDWAVSRGRIDQSTLPRWLQD